MFFEILDMSGLYDFLIACRFELNIWFLALDKVNNHESRQICILSADGLSSQTCL
jgi:hypothetical protein